VQTKQLLSLAATVAGERRTGDVLEAIVGGIAKQHGIALARIWLISSGDLCDSCFAGTECDDRLQCLQLVASAGASLQSVDQDWSSVDGLYRRIPLNHPGIGAIGRTGESILIKDFVPENDWVAQPDWARREGIRAFAGHPLIFHGKTLGALAIFSREPLDDEDFAWLRIFADQGAVAITNAQKSEDLVRAERASREQAGQLQQVIDVAPVHMFIWEADASVSYGNRAALNYFGPMPPTSPMEFLEIVTHPEDVARLKKGIARGIAAGKTVEIEARMRKHDGQYRWFLYQLSPLLDAETRIVRWCGVRIDIHDQKEAQERTLRENLALREEIDKVSMFEEIVGTSEPLQAVLFRVTKVARTESTVLITGETGTGKELIARAIHKKSYRAAGAFISANCATIPRDLIASELFGHEKGAFTGALQRRVGQFELAEGGTIFLDEIGELPLETQIALLRVLQEREFQRVGSNNSIRANVRVIAATNRDLPGAIATGTFRSDLFYRINVFPIQIPPLRERKEDVRVLVEYFIDRYSSKVGKKIRRIEKKSLARMQAYHWPGNIRELQNVIERSVILCETENFSVDESWLPQDAAACRPLSDELIEQEKEMIRAALKRTHGRVSGLSGAAVQLGMHPSTLDSKIKILKIDKRRFQTA
jgi:PAS domain S-box-containing protein